jgi:adenylylsulfate kinase
MSGNVKVIVITGTMGAGKTTVMAEAADLLTVAGVINAAIDFDALGIAHLTQEPSRDLAYRNLASVWSNYRTAGVRRLVIAAAVESQADMDHIFNSIPDSDEFIVCRLKVGLVTAQQRVRTREPGMLQEDLVARISELEKILDETKLEDFYIQNDNAQVTEVARQILRGAKWI